MKRGPVSPLLVWDLPVRLLHWALAAAVAVAWLSTLGWFRAHEPAGYVALGVVAARLAWGFAGGRYARFSQFVRGPRTTLEYTSSLWAGRESRYIGHNPLGGWMALALLGCVAALGVTGWLYTTDAFWGMAWLDQLHTALAWLLLGLAALHVAGVVFTSRRQRENLVRAMLSGSKAAPRPGDID